VHDYFLQAALQLVPRHGEDGSVIGLVTLAQVKEHPRREVGLPDQLVSDVMSP
jgi:hypothetical protein